uniref:glutathione transferase n=1 Tax=Larix kaempferi TaxID=54800 RepID=V5L6N8_9CONI|nr:tau class glutathione S-transferase [Larix kaempferi]
MEGEQVKVLKYWASPFSLRVQIALDLKGIPYEYVEEDLLNNKSQLLLQSNPVHKTVPVLIHNSKNICESLIVLEYIDETWEGRGVSLLLKSPHQRALARFWAAFIDDKLGHSISGMYRCLEKELRKKATNETMNNIALLEEAFGTAFNGLKGNPFFGGECIGYLDIVLGGLVVWIQVVEAITGVTLIDPETTPLLHAWLHRFCRVDSVKKSLPQFEKLLTYGYLVQKKFPMLTYE